MERSARIFGEGLPLRVSSQYHSSPSNIPPPTAPTASAAAARSCPCSPASASASVAAASARRSARERRREAGSDATVSGGISAATRERKPSVSMRVTGLMAQAPAARPDQKVFAQAPYGLMTPSPLTTTREPGDARDMSGEPA